MRILNKSGKVKGIKNAANIPEVGTVSVKNIETKSQKKLRLKVKKIETNFFF